MNSRTPLTVLTDDEIQVKAIIWRREALKGNKKAFGLAHMYESESRRRSASKGGTGFGTLDAKPASFWRRMLFWRSPADAGEARHSAKPLSETLRPSI